MPPVMTAKSLFRIGLVLIVFAVVLRLSVDGLLSAYGRYVGASDGLQNAAAWYVTAAAQMVVLPLGVGFFCGSFVLAGLARFVTTDSSASRYRQD